MKRRALLSWTLASACGTREKLGLGRALVESAVQARLCDAEEGETCLDELTQFVVTARREFGAKPESEPTQVLVDLMFQRWGFVREVADQSLSYLLLPRVVEHRRGSCVGLGSLFLTLAEALGVPAVGVVRPGHFYVRAGGIGRYSNIELLRSGEVMPDAWYETRFPIPGGRARAYARPLSVREVEGVIAYDVGNERRRQLRFAEARNAYSRAIDAFPDLAEAYASLGAVEQLMGDWSAAAASYRRAREVNPFLPGIAENLVLLEAERSERL